MYWYCYLCIVVPLCVAIAVAVKSAVVFVFMIAFLPAGDHTGKIRKSMEVVFQRKESHFFLSLSARETAAVPSDSILQGMS